MEQWFRRRGLPAVVRGRPRQLVVRTMPAIVWFAFSEQLYDLLDFMDGDSEFETRLASTAFVVLYSAALLGSIAVPAAAAWLVARVIRPWVVRGEGLWPALLLTGCYVVVWPIAAGGIRNMTVLFLGVLARIGVLVTLFLLTATGMGSVLGWALRAALRQIRGIGAMTSRSLPLLLLVTTFGFYTAEIWQAVGSLQRGQVWLVLGFYGVVGVLFLLSVLSAELRVITTLSESSPLGDLPSEHPFCRLMSPASNSPEPGPPLTRLEHANMVFMLLVTQAVQALIFGVVVFVLFVVLGSLSVPRKVMMAWAGHAPTQGPLFGIQIPMSNELLQVCMFIAGFSALYFIVTVVTDAAHRRTFFDPALDHLKVSLAVRAVYIARFARSPLAPPNGQPSGADLPHSSASTSQRLVHSREVQQPARPTAALDDARFPSELPDAPG